jgi:hypothetical protein
MKENGRGADFVPRKHDSMQMARDGLDAIVWMAPSGRGGAVYDRPLALGVAVLIATAIQSLCAIRNPGEFSVRAIGIL